MQSSIPRPAGSKFFGVWGLKFKISYRPLNNKPPPLNRYYNRDPNIKALKRRRFVNSRSTVGNKRI